VHGASLDKQWPCEKVELEAESYPYPYQLIDTEIDNNTWRLKEKQEIVQTFDDHANVKYQI
jgi:protease II